ARVEQRIEPLQTRNPRTGRIGDAMYHLGDAGTKTCDERRGLAFATEGGADTRDIGEDSLERATIERDDVGRRRERRRQLRDRDRADRAQRLTKKDIGPRVSERADIEMEGALAALRGVTHRLVDRATAGADRDRGARDARKGTDRRWKVAV